MNVQNVQKENNITVTVSGQAAKLRYGLGAFTSQRVQQDAFSLSNSAIIRKNPIEAVYEKFLLRYNQNALIERYMNEKAVAKMLESAPAVKQLLEEKGVNPTICIENLRKIENTHVNTTVAFAKAIADEMNLSKAEKETVALGSLFHDFGKIMIPEEIINKNGKLTPEERAVIDTHSRIGYELLKTTGMDTQALAIIRNHHRAASMTTDVMSKIVSVADVYSALTEKRSYKKEMSSEDAFKLMQSFVEEGKLDGEIVNALKSSLAKSSKQAA